MKASLRLEFTFPKNYDVALLEAPPPVHPAEKLYHYPVELEEGDRAGMYLRVVPQHGAAWRGFFALGFNASQAIRAVCSCPDPDSVCAIAGGYAYVVNVLDPAQWLQIAQRPVVDLFPLPKRELFLFCGFTSITALGRHGLAWTTGRLSWEGIRIREITEHKIRGFGWDALSDKEVAFEVDLKTGEHSGGAGPGPELKGN